MQIHDPIANSKEVEALFNLNITELSKITADVLIIAVGHEQYRNFRYDEILNLMRSERGIIADIKSILDLTEIENSKHKVFRL